MSASCRCRRMAAPTLVLLATLGGAAACTTTYTHLNSYPGGSGSSSGRPTTAPPAARLPAQDGHWLNQLHQADMAEMAAGQLAETNAGAASIRSVGATLAHDHSALDAKVLQVARKLDFSLVTYLTVAQTKAGDRFGAEVGFAFDHDFTATMMTAHQQMIAATQAETRHASSPPVKALARQALPVLRKHLAMLRAVAGAG